MAIERFSIYIGPPVCGACIHIENRNGKNPTCTISYRSSNSFFRPMEVKTTDECHLPEPTDGTYTFYPATLDDLNMLLS